MKSAPAEHASSALSAVLDLLTEKHIPAALTESTTDGPELRVVGLNKGEIAATVSVGRLGGQYLISLPIVAGEHEPRVLMAATPEQVAAMLPAYRQVPL